jgi:hypothetical protein
MDILIGLFWIGLILVAAITVFQLVAGVVIMLVMAPVALGAWLVDKVRSK